MPQLQNNNRTPIKSNQGNVPRNGSYINEVKVTEYKNIQKNSTTILRGIADFGVQVGEKIQELETKKQQIDMENKFNDYTRDFSNRTKLYQAEYTKNPDQKLTDQYENDIKNMTESYEGQIPFAFKNNFLERTNLLQKNTNLDFFRKITEINYQNEKFTNSLNDSLESVNTNSYLGNQQAINYEIANLPLRKRQLIDIYGDIEGNNIYKKYTKDFIKSYIGGKLSADDTADIDNLLNIIQSNDELKDRLTPQEIENYKNQAIEKQEKLKQLQKNKESIEYLVKTNSIVNDIYNNKLNNYTDIVNKLKESGASEYESKMILNFAGYSTELPPDLKENISGGGIAEKELKRKKTETEKIQFEDELNNMITSIYGGVEDTENIEDRETVNDRINLIQKKLIEGVAGGYITANKHSNYMNMLTPYMNDILTKTVKEISPDPWFFGKSEIQKEVNKILKISNLDTSDPKKLKDADRKKYYYIKTRYFNSYIKSMRQQFEDIKKRDVNNKYGNVNNWIDFKKTVDEDIRKKMENKAIKDMLVDYSQNELNIKLTGEETNDEILNYIETVENNNLKTDFKNDIMELQYSREY